jgi:hypothetical protein
MSHRRKESLVYRRHLLIEYRKGVLKHASTTTTSPTLPTPPTATVNVGVMLHRRLCVNDLSEMVMMMIFGMMNVEGIIMCLTTCHDWHRTLTLPSYHVERLWLRLFNQLVPSWYAHTNRHRGIISKVCLDTLCE